MNKENPAQKDLIYLAGFMGSGKSTIGPILANTIGFNFIDIDKFIERKADKKIVDIFANEGEQVFRRFERGTLEELSTLKRCVISLGGGTIANEENFRMVRRNGIIVYLQLSPEEILHRVHHKSDRPMLRDERGEKLSEDEMQHRIQQLLRHREEYYSRADIIIRTENKKVGVTVDEIVKKLRGYIKP